MIITKPDAINYANCCSIAMLSKTHSRRECNRRLQERGFTKIDWFSISATSTQGFIASNDRRCVVCFRASEDEIDWDNNFMLWKRGSRWKLPGLSMTKCGKAHAGFVHAFTSAHPEILALLSDHKSARVVVVGHSLGGALANIAAAELGKVDACVTFGAPRVFSFTAARQFNKLGVNHIRFVNIGDTIVRLPWSILGLTHTGRERLFSMDYTYLKQVRWWERGYRIVRDLMHEFFEGEIFAGSDHKLTSYVAGVLTMPRGIEL